MELRHLRYLIAVAEAGTIGRAARRMLVAQQAVSRQLRDLERELGVVLLVRGPDGVVLTAAGEELVATARASLAALDGTLAALRAAAGGAPVVLTLGTVELGLRSGIVAAALRRVGAGLASGAAPEMDVRVFQLASLAQWAALRDRSLDLAVVSWPPPADHADLATAPLTDDPLTTAYVPSGWRPAAAHPASARGGTDAGEAGAGEPVAAITLAELLALPLIVFPRHVNPAFHERLDTALAVAGAASLARREASDGPAAWTMVSAGLGWTLEPRSSAAADLPRPPGVTPVPIRDFAVPFGLHLAWRRGDTRPTVDRLRRALQGAATPGAPRVGTRAARPRGATASHGATRERPDATAAAAGILRLRRS